jgi:UDPglucose 6-dehydrogenase
MNTDKICLIGLGKLGLPLLCTFAKSGQKIIGLDVDKNKMELLQNKTIPFYEPQLEEYLNDGFDNIFLNETYETVLNEVDVAIILVNTPSNLKGEFSNNYIYQSVEKLTEMLKTSNKKDFLFIISSTVMPSSHESIISRIETISGRKLNNGFGYVYLPDLVALGSVIKDFENPDLLILGESESRYGDIAEKIYKNIIKNNAPIVRMSVIESEITKVSLNAYITMKISFANFIGNVAEKYNCNSNNITKALGCDRRISPYYIKSGLAFGGTCFPRDTWAFIKMSENIGLDAVHIKATQKINERQNEILFERVKEYKDKSIGVIGLSFKPNTTVDVESPGRILYDTLVKNNYTVSSYDPLLQNQHSLEEMVNLSEVVIITHNDKKLISNLDFKNKIVIDCWNLLK